MTRIETRPVQVRLAVDFKRWIAIAGLVAAAAVACGGCGTPPTPLERESQDKWLTPDVPVPEEFVLDREVSRVYDRGHREMRLVYRRESYDEAKLAVAFYKEAFPERGWQLRFVYGEPKTMLFWKGDEEARVTVDQNSGYVWAVIEVEPKDIHSASASAIARKAE